MTIVEMPLAEFDGKEWYQQLTHTVAPRPIAWITTVNEDGLVNLAPFSWFQAVCADPPILMVAFAKNRLGQEKDTLRNLRRVKECVIHGVPAKLGQAMVDSSAAYPPEASEVAALDLKTTPSRTVQVPRLQDGPWGYECTLREVHDFPTTSVAYLDVRHGFAQAETLDESGRVRIDRIHQLARTGKFRYVETTKEFELTPSG